MNLELPDLVRLAATQALGILLSVTLQLCGKREVPQHQLLAQMLGILVLKIAEQTLHEWNYLLDPNWFF